jgi:hypothetical protein
MASIESKKSSNQIDQSPYLFGLDTDAKALSLDKSVIRLVSGTANNLITGLSSGSGQFFSTNFTVTGEEETENSIAYLIPKLEDITIKSMVLDYSTNPVSVKLILRVKNSTGYPVAGISGRVPKK